MLTIFADFFSIELLNMDNCANTIPAAAVGAPIEDCFQLKNNFQIIKLAVDTKENQLASERPIYMSPKITLKYSPSEEVSAKVYYKSSNKMSFCGLLSTISKATDIFELDYLCSCLYPPCRYIYINLFSTTYNTIRICKLTT